MDRQAQKPRSGTTGKPRNGRSEDFGGAGAGGDDHRSPERHRDHHADRAASGDDHDEISGLGPDLPARTDREASPAPALLLLTPAPVHRLPSPRA